MSKPATYSDGREAAPPEFVNTSRDELRELADSPDPAVSEAAQAELARRVNNRILKRAKRKAAEAAGRGNCD